MSAEDDFLPPARLVSRLQSSRCYRQYGDHLTVTERLDKETIEHHCGEIDVDVSSTVVINRGGYRSCELIGCYNTVKCFFLSYVERKFKSPTARVVCQPDKEWKRSWAPIAKDGRVAPHAWHLSPWSFSSPSLSHASSARELPCVDRRAWSVLRPA